MKRIFIFLFLMLLLLTTTLFFNKNNRKHYIEQNGILLAISDGNGGTLNSVPSKDFYDVTVDCTNGEGSWDYNLWQVVVRNVTGNVTCDLTFKSISASQTLAEYITSLTGTTQGEGQVVNENGYRYEGKDPSNYIWFNNEMWRIIGVFGSNRHGITNTNLVKIIRNQSIGSYAWNGVTNYPNNWPNTTLYFMLNGCYYNALNSSDTTNISGSSVACSNYCIGFSDKTANCDFSLSGIQNEGLDVGYRDMIQTVTWYLGGPGASGYTTYYPANIYNYEINSSAIYSGNSTSVTGDVGLMYLSDYGYSAPGSNCTRGSYTMNVDSSSGYVSTVCAGNSWLYGQGDEWTITPDSSSSNKSLYVRKNGNNSVAYSRSSCSVRPVVYLNTKTYKLDGTGTQKDPYIVGMKDDYEYARTFNYYANVQTVQIVKSGYYKLEVYGAKGGNANSPNYLGGNGGYAKGVVHLNKNDTLYIHTGGSGSIQIGYIQTGGTNGGGAGGNSSGGSGGGATDIRINTDSLYARVIVGGGGGGAANNSGHTGGVGGGTTGGNGSGYSATYSAKGGGTTSGGAAGGYSGYKGTDGSFGAGGAAATSNTSNYGRSGGGGGGWYGGGGGGYRSSSSYYYYGQSGGGGGSSYTYSSETASQVPSGWLLNSNYYMTNTSTTAGVNAGDGYAKVTYCGKSASGCS